MSNSGMALWQHLLVNLPLIAILRGIRPAEAVSVAGALQSAGFLCVEIPLNSPHALASIRAVRDHFDGELLVGAGTVLTQADVVAVNDAGAQIVVSPNTDSQVITSSRQLGLISLPGFATPTEALQAIAAGATGLKLFPAEATSPATLAAIRTVLPGKCPIFPVGGITTARMPGFIAAGADGFGIGSSLYTAGMEDEEVVQRASAFVQTWRVSRSSPIA
jgi:2-dehydro-3-deoxyphosphogalactonate aldolase